MEGCQHGVAGLNSLVMEDDFQGRVVPQEQLRPLGFVSLKNFVSCLYAGKIFTSWGCLRSTDTSLPRCGKESCV